MADEKSNKSKKDPDSKKTGNSCGFSLGCLIIVIAVSAIVFFLFLKPLFDDAGYSYDELKEKVFALKDKVGDAFERGKDKYDDIKDGTEEHWDDLKDLDDKAQDELDKTAPELVAD